VAAAVPGNAAAQVAVDSEVKPFGEAPVQRASAVLPQQFGAPVGIDVLLEPPDLTAVLAEDEILSEQKGVRRIGIFRRFPAGVAVSSRQASHGRWTDLPDGGSAWTLTIHSAQAEGIRVHVEDVRLPGRARLVVYSTNNPQETHGPYDARYLGGRSEFWTETVFDSTVTLECYVPPGVDAGDVSLNVQEITHQYVKIGDLIPKVGTCHNDVMCYSAWSTEANGVAGLGTIGSVGSVWCTGTLLNDFDAETFEDYFMTANHCLSGDSVTLATQVDANTIEFYWFYQTSTCDGTPPNPATVPRTGGGADLLGAQTRASGSDFAFLRIRNTTPGGTAYLGWTTGSPGSGDALTGIHHPSGSFKRISFGNLVGSNANYWDVKWSSGVTEPGSSGSPLFNADKRFIGQLRGGGSSCSNPTAIDDYGRFNVTYPNIQTWFEIGGTIHVDGGYVGTERGTPAEPFNTVGEANNLAWNGVRIQIQAGSYPETLVFTKELTVLATGGTVVIGQ